VEFIEVVPTADNAPWLLRPPADRRLTVAEARERLTRLPPPGRIDGFPNVRSPQPAALFIPLGDLDGEAALAATKRPETMLRHRNHWVFPGGRLDAGVDASTREAAVREASEELGFPPAEVSLVGQLATRGPISTGFVLDVFVGLVDFAHLAPDPHEVADCAVVPVSALAAGYHETFKLPELEVGPLADGVVLTLDRPRERPLRFFEVRAGEYLWGLQGEILHELLCALLPAQ